MFAPLIAKARTTTSGSLANTQAHLPTAVLAPQPRRRAMEAAVKYSREREAAPRVQGDFSSIPAFSPDRSPLRPPFPQAQLVEGDSDDPLERQADLMADRALAAPATVSVIDARATAPGFRRPAGAIDGELLEPTLREDMGQRFGSDFSRVRIYTGATAQRSASQVNANAYTSGHNIVFDAGRFAPATGQGRRLLAHELAHVVQQNGAARNGRARPTIQCNKRGKAERTEKDEGPTVELDHGSRGHYLIHFNKPNTRDEVLGMLFTDGALPSGYTLEDKGVYMLGWTWRLTTTNESVFDVGTYLKLTPAFQRHFSSFNSLVGLTGEETAAIHASREEFMDSRPPYLPGQSVREAFKECRDNKVGKGWESGCWGKRAGYFYYIGPHRGYLGAGRELEVKTSPELPDVIKDWEWWLNQGYTLDDAARAEEELQTEVLRQMIFAYASALSAAPGAIRRPTVAPSPVRQVGQIISKAVQARQAWKTALGKDTTELDMWLAAAAGTLEEGTTLLRTGKQPKPTITTGPPPEPTPVPPSAPPVLGSKDQAHWSETPRVSPNQAESLKPGDRDVTDLNAFSKQRTAIDKVRQNQQAAKAANDNRVEAQTHVAVGQNVTPTSQTGAGPYASLKGAKPTASVTIGKVSSSQTIGRSDPKVKDIAPPSPRRTAVKNLVPEPYPMLPRGSRNYTNEELLNFYRSNYALYPEEIQQMIDNIPTTGRVNTAQRKQLDAISSAISRLHTEDANFRVVGGRPDEPFVKSKKAGTAGDQFSAALTGNKQLNLTGQTKSGELVEFDSVRLVEHRLLETKMYLSPWTTSGDVMDQMRRQAIFAEDWGFSQVRWEVWDHDSYLTAKHAHDELSRLNPKLGSRIDVTNPSDAFR